MKNRWRIVFCLSFLVAANLQLFGADRVLKPGTKEEPTVIACVGDLVSLGRGKPYSEYLQRCLGEFFKVINLAVDASETNLSAIQVWQERYWGQLADARPHVILMMFGTEACLQKTGSGVDGFKSELQALLRRINDEHQSVRLFLCLPPPIYSPVNSKSLARLSGEIIPFLKALSRERGVPLIDVHIGLSGRSEAFDQGYLPNAYGGALISQVICYEIGSPD